MTGPLAQADLKAEGRARLARRVRAGPRELRRAPQVRVRGDDDAGRRHRVRESLRRAHADHGRVGASDVQLRDHEADDTTAAGALFTEAAREARRVLMMSARVDFEGE